MIRIFLIINICFALILNSGCSPTNVLASGGATTMVVAEGDRTLGTVIDDATIKVKIGSKFLTSENAIPLPLKAVWYSPEKIWFESPLVFISIFRTFLRSSKALIKVFLLCLVFQ